jgi:hypothetical protein
MAAVLAVAAGAGASVAGAAGFVLLSFAMSQNSK